ncbi:MAG: hypothetical protein CVU11_09395 [Bacteroidetes bacterium HGW-Bacteroidetes-6]|jgi:glycosyltransferase involved in cell wall biosynthesis|nr:MAG: hypothetical protein CVU11_09395 [Bacteroidetes bacterium HGW-Bacteroidetes-6]
MTSNTSHIYVAIPALNELDFIGDVLSDLVAQEMNNFSLFVCVNQPERWWQNDKKVTICQNNLKTIDFILDFCGSNNIQLTLIDRSSPGKGWPEKQGGVGWARKVLMDAISEIAVENDIIVSLDADTRVESNYLQEIARQFALFPKASSMALPYFHEPQGDEDHQKSMLRYEIYLRSYAINLLRIGHPFAYTPIGSAMAARVSAYRKIRGLQATSSGEDFYFMMKLRKTGIVIPFCETRVYPSSRKSNRVIFGTGPTVALGAPGQVERYPIYHPQLFDEIAAACGRFAEIFETENSEILQKILDVFPDLEYEKLRKNNPQLNRFIHACFSKADAFAIYKYVKAHQPSEANDIESIDKLLDVLKIEDQTSDAFRQAQCDFSLENETIQLHHLSIENLNTLRHLLMQIEEKFLQEKYNEYFAHRNEKTHDIWKLMS